MSRADQISWWIEQGEAMQGLLAEGFSARQQLSGLSWFEEEVRRGKGSKVAAAAEISASPVLRGATITGGQDEERRRTLGAGSGMSGAGRSPFSGASATRSSAGGSALAPAAATGQGTALSRARMLAAGYQPAVVKVVSYARGAARATATGQYIQRDDVPLETHDGRMLGNGEAVAEEIQKWYSAFSKRAESRDIAEMRITLQGVADTPQGRALYSLGIAAALTGHRHAWRLDRTENSALEARVVTVLAGQGRERFRIREQQVSSNGRTGSNYAFERNADTLLRDRITAATGLSPDAISIAAGPTGHGRDGVIYRLNRLVAKGAATDDHGASIATAADSRKAAREWARSLRSQSARDTMHLILSAKAGTPPEALTRAARNFLQDRFADHRFMFGLHTDKEAEGHIHVHAVIAVRSETGHKLHPGRETFRDWRMAYAEHAQAEGLKIVATSARERASSQSYGAMDKAIIAAAERPRPKREAKDRAYAADPANQGLIQKARQRIARAKANPVPLPTSDKARGDIAASLRIWTKVAEEQPGNAFAQAMQSRLTLAHGAGPILAMLAQSIGKSTATRIGQNTATSFSTRNANRADELTQENPAMAVTSAEMIKDLRLMNEAVSRASDQLSGETKHKFQQASARYLEVLANRIDLQRLHELGVQELTRAELQAVVGNNADALIAKATELQQRRALETPAAKENAAGEMLTAHRQQATIEQSISRTESSRASQNSARYAGPSTVQRTQEAVTENSATTSNHEKSVNLVAYSDQQAEVLDDIRREQERILNEIKNGEELKPQSQKNTA